jgi:hypothetical protein
MTSDYEPLVIRIRYAPIGDAPPVDLAPGEMEYHAEPKALYIGETSGYSRVNRCLIDNFSDGVYARLMSQVREHYMRSR